MTTTVKVHVNGRYKATVTQTKADGTVLPPVEVDGNYEGTSNPGGEKSFSLMHPADATFRVVEEYLGDK